MTKNTHPPVASNSNPSSTVPSNGPPIWIRMGVPAACAALAAMLNFAAVKRQIQPSRAYAVAQNLPAGTRLQASHLQLIDLAGTFDRSAVFLEQDLLLHNGDTGKNLPLAESLAQTPRILTRRTRAGEILVKSSVGGTEAPGQNEGVTEVDRKVLNVSDDLLAPGRLIHFMVARKGDKPTDPTRFIGPFRVAWQDAQRVAGADQRKDTIVRIVFPTQGNRPTADSEILLKAIAHPKEFTLHGQMFGNTSRTVQNQATSGAPRTRG